MECMYAICLLEIVIYASKGANGCIIFITSFKPSKNGVLLCVPSSSSCTKAKYILEYKVSKFDANKKL